MLAQPQPCSLQSCGSVSCAGLIQAETLTMQVRQKYKTVNAGSVCKATPRVYDMKEYMDLPLGDHAKTEDALKGELLAQAKSCVTLLSQSLGQARIQTNNLCMHPMRRAGRQRFLRQEAQIHQKKDIHRSPWGCVQLRRNPDII